MTARSGQRKHLRHFCSPKVSTRLRTDSGFRNRANLGVESAGIRGGGDVKFHAVEQCRTGAGQARDLRQEQPCNRKPASPRDASPGSLVVAPERLRPT